MILMLVFSQAAIAANPVKVEVLYMNHGPLMDTLSKMKAVFSGFGDKITVSWYDFESDSSAKFKAQKGITQHTPLVIWIDGKSTVKVDNKEVTFYGFPNGSGPSFFQGKWTLDDLKNALKEATFKK
jgi:hypothetical protein